MIQNEATYAFVSPDNPTREGLAEVFLPRHAVPVPWVEPGDVSRVVLFAASDDARFTTGAMLMVDLGITV
jgi:NAD(P)-dependent dehydrogenase (short-subunit alcohol dehydrogenase family)